MHQKKNQAKNHFLELVDAIILPLQRFLKPGLIAEIYSILGFTLILKLVAKFIIHVDLAVVDIRSCVQMEQYSLKSTSSATGGSMSLVLTLPITSC